MLDFFDDIVFPAFCRPRETDPQRKANCFILDPRITEIKSGDIGSLALTGLFVKDSKLEREEIVDRTGKLIEAPEEMSSASSAVFILLLGSHRLLYMKRQSYAPEMQHFASFLRKQFKSSHADYTARLNQELPPPKLEVIPIASTGSVADLLNRYSVIKSLTIKLVPTNNEIDNTDLFKPLRHAEEDTRSKKSSVTFVGDKENGLDKNGCARQIEPATKQGNATVIFVGKNLTGAELTMTNEECKMRVPLDELIAKQPLQQVATQLYKTFQELVNDRQITVDKSPVDKSSIIERIKNKFAQ
jgi:hypothetical protein